MNKFADWIESNDKKQRGVAKKIGISASTLHDIVRKGQIPSLLTAYEIEKYTRGAITLYDWLDERKKEATTTPKIKSPIKTKPKNK